MKIRFFALLLLGMAILLSQNSSKSSITGQNLDNSIKDAVHKSVEDNQAEDLTKNIEKEIEILKTIYFVIILFLLSILIPLLISHIREKKNNVSKKDLEKYLTIDQFSRNKRVLATKKGLEKYLLIKEFEKSQELIFVSDRIPVDGIVKGNEEIEERNFTIAEIYFKQELFRRPEQTNAWVGLAHSYCGLERYREALDAIRTAIKLDRKNPYFNKSGQISIIEAEILVKLERFSEAREVLEREVLVINPFFKKAKQLLDECNRVISTKSN